MAMDRYVAICEPLNYATIMSWQVCIILIVLVWIGSFTHSVAQIILALRLPFCGSNLIDHYCCDMQPLLKLACMDIYVMNLLMVISSGHFVQAILSFWYLLHCYLAFALEPQCKREEKAPFHLQFPCNCSCLIIWFMCIYIYSAPNHIPHGQNVGSILHVWNTLPQSTHLHTEECRSEKCHEKVMACQNYLRKQKTNCGPGLIVYWVMVLVNLYKLTYMTMLDSCGNSINKIKVCFALFFFLIHRQDEYQSFSFLHGPNLTILIMIPCQSLFFDQFSSVKLLSCVWLFATPWTAGHKASLYITNRAKTTLKEILMYLYFLGHCKVQCLNWQLKSLMWCIRRPICMKENRSVIILLQAHLV